MQPQFRAVVCVSAFLLIAGGARAQSGSNVLVVASDTVPGSLEIAERYAAARAVPKDQLLRLKTSAAERIPRAEFERDIQAPIVKWLAANSRQDRILYIVLTRGIPLRIAGTGGRNGTVASVDSELALLYRRMTGATALPTGPISNPYFAGTAGIETLKPFSHAAHDIYLVTRLDGFSVEDALALIDRGLSPAKDGRILLDGMPASRDVRGEWFETAAARLRTAGLGDRVVHETTSRALQNQTGVLGYYSWGSNDPSITMRTPGLAFVPGALAAMFLSTDARTFTQPPAGWAPGRPSGSRAFAGSSQSLIADLVRSGATGIAGQVAEPYLDGAIRPDILFPSYMAGFNLAEAFYSAMPSVSWQTVVVGDPLCAPFRTTAVAAGDIDPPIDPDTELPALFSARRLAALGVRGSPAVLKLLLQAETRLARSDSAGAVESLTKAVSLDETFAPAWRLLASAYEGREQYPEADAVYRRLLTLNRNDAFALNNLAYSLAVRGHQPEEALPLATRAAALAPRIATFSDTLGWIHHLLGNDQEALRLIEPASRVLTRNAEVQFHVAAIYASSGRLDDAAKALQSASKLDPSMETRADFREVQQKIKREGRGPS
jgi:uncharacterized protein (TIGR03790 family)